MNWPTNARYAYVKAIYVLSVVVSLMATALAASKWR
jgi:hypothetical protein